MGYLKRSRFLRRRLRFVIMRIIHVLGNKPSSDLP